MNTTFIKGSILCLALTASVASAQVLPTQPYLNLNQQSAWLLTVPTVKAQLNLTSDQQRSIGAAFGRYAGEEQGLFKPGGPAPTKEKIQSLDVNLASTVLHMLNSSQSKRLEEITFQLKGPEALLQPSVVRRVGLKPAQKATITHIFSTANARQRAFDEGLAQKLLKLPRGDQLKRIEVVKASRADQARLADQRKADEARALAVLTPAQRGTWTKLLGAPFKR